MQQFLITTLTKRNKFLQLIDSLSLSSSPRDVASITITIENSIPYLTISLTPTITTISTHPLIYTKIPLSLIDLQLSCDDDSKDGRDDGNRVDYSIHHSSRTQIYLISLNNLSSILKASIQEAQKGSKINFTSNGIEIISSGSLHTIPFHDTYPSMAPPPEPSINRPEITIEFDLPQLRSIQQRLTSIFIDSGSKFIIKVSSSSSSSSTFSFILSEDDKNLEIKWIISSSSIEFYQNNVDEENLFILNSSSFIRVINSLICASNGLEDASSNEVNIIMALIPNELVVLTMKSIESERMILFYIPLIMDI